MVIKVLQVNVVYGVKSTGRNCFELATELEGDDFAFYSAYAIESSIKPENGFLIGNYLDHKVHAFLSRISGLQGYFSRASTLRLIGQIEKIGPDIVHINNLHSNYINLGELITYIAKNNIGLVATLHDCWFFTGKCTHFTNDNCQRWKNSCGECPRLAKDNPSWFFDRTSKMLEDKRRWFSSVQRLAVVGVSNWISNQARESILKNASDIRTIYNWVDLDVFKPLGQKTKIHVANRFGFEVNSFLILFVASEWNESKGIFRIPKILSALGPDYRAIVVGRLRQPIDFPDTVIHLGETDNVGQLVEYYSAADVFVNLSNEETFGKVTAEAMACGTPVVVMDSTANPEIVGKNCGYVVNPESDLEVIEAIFRIRHNGKSSYQSDCRKHAVTCFSKQHCVGQYRALYEQLAG